MYSLVLVMALSDGAALPSAVPQNPVAVKRVGTQELNRGRRHGCCGCCGGCWGCYGGCYGGYYGCYGGCYGGYYGGCYDCYGGVAPAAPAAPAQPPEPAPVPKKKGGEEASRAPATIYVSLPADAKLTIDDAPTASTSATRVFATPTLEGGKEYYYTLKAQVTRDGKVLSATQRVTVRAGQATRVTLEVPDATGVASK